MFYNLSLNTDGLIFISADLSLILVSLAQIILNPDSRTLHGLEALIERDWIQGEKKYFL